MSKVLLLWQVGLIANIKLHFFCNQVNIAHSYITYTSIVQVRAFKSTCPLAEKWCLWVLGTKYCIKKPDATSHPSSDPGKFQASKSAAMPNINIAQHRTPVTRISKLTLVHKWGYNPLQVNTSGYLFSPFSNNMFFSVEEFHELLL